ncbi:hypothetical protein SMDB11_4657A [Serratia marcescens subsp. marcescens Db11]|uniref:Uncharacterized protein n=1 Tax=Serratia marcescens subsp. marcescens Db11 TaxID=273526 RepID=A0ABC9IR03_SERMA|nr:hypothetical protein SMDB11_4657A [Serratia marcescens subsp. marcescens Db11]
MSQDRGEGIQSFCGKYCGGDLGRECRCRSCDCSLFNCVRCSNSRNRCDRLWYRWSRYRRRSRIHTGWHGFRLFDDVSGR